MRIVLILTIILITSTTSAAVSAKIITLSEMWISSTIIGIVFFTLSYNKLWFVYVGLFISLLFITLVYGITLDKHSLSAILQKRGEYYILNGYISSSLIAVLSCLGRFTHQRRQKRNET